MSYSWYSDVPLDFGAVLVLNFILFYSILCRWNLMAEVKTQIAN
jgi:hypothetical protein